MVEPSGAAEKGGFPVFVFALLIIGIIIAILAYLYYNGAFPFSIPFLPF
jgi:hypothetical protein